MFRRGIIYSINIAIIKNRKTMKGGIRMLVKDKTIIVTGAGGGVGRELTRELLSRGASVAALDINKEALQETKQLSEAQSKKISIHVIDITDEDAIGRISEEVKRIHGSVDGIINNAGIIQPFIGVNELGNEKIRQVMDINFYGTLNLVKALLPEFLKRPEAHIVNVSSMGGFLPVPGQSVYGASKAAVKLMTEGLHSELIETNVNVSIVFPGAIETNITKNSGVERESSGDDSQKNKMTSPQEAAKIIIDGMEKNKYRILVGSDAKMMDFLYRLMPKKAASIIADKLK